MVLVPHMTRYQTLTRLESQGFRFLDDIHTLTVEKDGWEKTYDWSDVSTERIVDDYMAFMWSEHLS